MDIQLLRCIVAIAELRSISKAAEKLYVTQPALSKMLKRAEDEFNCQIFFRKYEAFTPTDTGAIILEYAKKIIDSYHMLESTLLDITELNAGKVILGLPATVGLLFFIPIISGFRKAWPNIDFRWKEGGAAELAQEVLEGRLDMSIAASPVRIANLNEISLFRDEIAYGMRTDHPLAAKERIMDCDLIGTPILTYTPEFSVYKLFTERMKKAGITPILDCPSTQSDIIVELTVWGNGVCVLPRPALQYYHYPDLAIRSFSPILPWELCLLYRKNSYISDAARCLQIYIQNSFEKYNQELITELPSTSDRITLSLSPDRSKQL